MGGCRWCHQSWLPENKKKVFTFIQSQILFLYTDNWTSCFCSYCDVVVVLRHVDESRQALAKPHGDLSVHVDSKGFKSFLKATHGVVLERASVFPQIHATHLRQAETTDWNKPWRTAIGQRGGRRKRSGVRRDLKASKNTHSRRKSIQLFQKGNLEASH